MSGGIISGQKTNSSYGRYFLFIIRVMNDNWRVEQNIQRIANNSDVSNWVGSAFAGFVRYLFND